MRTDRLHAHSEGGTLLFVYLITAVATLGGLLFGYDTAVISGAVGALRERFGLNDIQTGWATASALVGCIAGAACAGMLGDCVGRKGSLLVTAVLFLLSAVGSALPRSLGQFAAARIAGGVGVGAAAMLSPLYIAEIAPARIRGRLVSLNQLAIIGGMLVVYFVNAWIHSMGDTAWNVSVGWRWMFASEVLPAGLFFLCLLGVPESPRYLAKKGLWQEARAVLTRIGGTQHAQGELRAIEEVLERTEARISELFRPGFRTALAIGVCLAVLQQVTGINVIMYYAPEIFKNAGLTETAAFSSTVIVGAVNLLFTFVAIAVVDLLGRKPLLAVASFGMGLSLTALGLCFKASAENAFLVVVFSLTYVAFFAVAMGPVVWVVLSEIYPIRFRGSAMSIATVCLWSANLLVTLYFPSLLAHLSGSVFYLYAALCAVALLFVMLCLPETKGRTLEEIEASWLSDRA